MATGKLTPRQKMINMMYLVLTALLALNVSKEVLDAFIVVNEGMVVQKGNIERKNNLTLADFEELKILYDKPEQREYYEKTIKPWFDKALDVNKMATELVDYIENMKAELVASA
ncbi:MAG: gliding motility protein GldM, partial [Bacteroidia bacterium]|nr:gliding motility protein GldM [Bacteroidia bacterium]